MILWAHVDAETREIVTHGHATGMDVFLQQPPEGQEIVPRPDHVTASKPWRHVDGEWVLTSPVL